MNDNLDEKIKKYVLDKIEEKVINLKIKLLNKYIASSDEYYYLTEPSEELMNELNKTFWIQPYNEEI